MNILQLLACARGHHRRDRRLAWLHEGHYHSWCTGCGKPMKRSAYGDWELESAPPPPPPEHPRFKG